MRLLTLFLFWLFTISTFEVYADDQAFKVLTAKGAYEVEKYNILDNATQLNYRINLEYPVMAVGKEHYQQLGELGWNECTGTRTDWDNYPDLADVNHPFCAHEFGKYLIKGNSLMLISLRYQSKLADGLRCLSAPDNSVQTVIVVIYKHNKTEDMGLKRLKLTCGKVNAKR